MWLNLEGAPTLAIFFAFAIYLLMGNGDARHGIASCLAIGSSSARYMSWVVERPNVLVAK